MHLHPHVEEKVEEKEVDFFEEHEKTFPATAEPAQLLNVRLTTSPVSKYFFLLLLLLQQTEEKPKSELIVEDDSAEPTINFESNIRHEERKPTIGGRKAPPKKSGVSFIFRRILR